MFGWCGKILRVNLTTGQIQEETLDPQVAKDYIGARGLGIYYLSREVSPECDPLSPENLMVMATGPLTGTKAPTGARYVVTTRAPLTGLISCSNSGGYFPTELKKAGWDALLISGQAPKPVYLWIDNGHVELRSAQHLWGLDTHQTTDTLRTETHPRARVSCIGPAGENLALIAAIMNDKDRAAGRSGVGAVMGSKKLKAIVVRGDREVPLADEARFAAFNKQVLDKFKDGAKKTPPGLRLHGTAVTVLVTQNYGALPTKNFQQGTFDGWRGIHGETLTEKYLVHAKPCYACPIACGRVTKVEVPGFEGEGEGPEYETVYAMGSNCLIDDLAAITKANYLCNELGLDTISMGATMACAMELYDRGYLPEADIGQPLKWGDGQALVDLTRQTGLGQGFGRLLAEGSYRLASRYGHPELAMVAKKQEFPGYDPRASQGMGLAYATSPIGGSHMRGDPAYFELIGVPSLVDPLDWKSKPPLVKIWQDFFCVIDAAGLCVFFSVRNLARPVVEMPPEGILEYLNAATGANYTLAELVQAGERIANAERLYLSKMGVSKKDDTLPPRLTQEPMPTGPAKGHVCHLEEMLGEYYQLRGWTPDGVPTTEKLRELGLA